MKSHLNSVETQPPCLSIVIPCFNEEDVLPETAKRLVLLLQEMVVNRQISSSSRIIFIDDGSSDNTWNLIEEIAGKSQCIGGIKLSRNRGHQNALIAGLFTAEGDILVSVDADLQDDIGAIPKMINQYNCGFDIVYGVRYYRSKDSLFKRSTAQWFYRLMRVLGAESVDNHADFRLMSRRAIEALKQFNEVNLFLRGIVPLIGFKSAIVYYERAERFAGESKYPLRKMISLAFDAVTSFSIVPLRLITLLGFLVFSLSTVITVWTLWVRFFTIQAVPGWASTVLPIYFMGGVQILSIGIIGEYLGKIYQETKARPRYIIEKSI